MQISKKYIIAILATIIVYVGSITSNTTIAQTINQTQIRINDGLSNNHITSLLIDSRGYLWIGTEDGLNRYDGTCVKVYRHSIGTETSISDNYIQTITEDYDNNILIGTRYGGINKWIRSSNKFEQTKKNQNDPTALRENEIQSILSISPNSAIVKSRSYLSFIDFTNNNVSSYGHFTNVFKSNTLNNYPIVRTKKNNVIIGTKDGITIFNQQTKTFTRLKEVANSNDFLQASVYDIIPNGNGYLAATTQGLFSFNENEQAVHAINLPFKYESNSITKFLPKTKNSAWISTKQMLYLIDLSTFQAIQSIIIESIDSSSQNQVSAITEDKSGIIWIGTTQNGLVKINTKPTRFASINLSPIEKYNITSLSHKSKESMWIGTKGHGLWKLSLNENLLTEIDMNIPDSIKTQLEILSLFESSRNELWIGTNKGIYIHAINSKKTIEFSSSLKNEFANLLKSNEIRAIIADKVGNIWLATKFGLYKYNGTKIESFFSDSESENLLNHDEINCLWLDSEDILWVGTRKGLNFLDTKSGTFKKQTLPLEKANELINDRVLSICQDANDNFLIGTSIGLIVFNKKNNWSRIYTTNNGLINDVINSVTSDQMNRIWIGTNNGISLILNNLIINYTHEDGINSNIYNLNSVCKNINGRLYFGGTNGINYLNTGKVDQNTTIPKVVINSISHYQKNDLINHQEGEITEIELKFDKTNTIRVNFASLEFTQPKQNQYKTFLEGFDEKWSEPTKQNFAIWSNLPVGTYKLHIKGSNNDLVWNEEPTTLTIIVTAPLYLSIYAYIFYVIILILAIQIIVNYWIRDYKKELQKMRALLEDNLKKGAKNETLVKINKSLTDSINYAKRIQEAMLFSEQAVKQLIPDSFIYFRPKDIVSGDFYFFHVKEQKLIVSVIDCTGHGVPGAFMSIIGYDLLRNIIETQGIECPAKILDILNDQLNNIFYKESNPNSARNIEVNDGMDMSLCVIDYEKRVIDFAGANNSLYLIRDNELEEFEGNRMAIGTKGAKDNFTKKQIPLFDNDILYLFSDGYTDQFGGIEGKKFKFRRFRHLLLNIHKLPMDDQKAIIHQKMEEWMGNSYEQVDDILLIGLKPIQNTLA